MLKFSVLLLAIFGSLATAIHSIAGEPIVDVDNYRALTSDHRAYRVGEPLVILVVESTVAESSAGTGIARDIEISASDFDNTRENAVSLGIGSRGNGEGQTIRKGKASTQLSARIVEVLPNNVFRIEGKQSLMINGEDQLITLSGIVRAYDISGDNTLMSNRIAGAQIEIHGRGDISKAQRQSLVTKVFQWMGIL